MTAMPNSYMRERTRKAKNRAVPRWVHDVWAPDAKARGNTKRSSRSNKRNRTPTTKKEIVNGEKV